MVLKNSEVWDHQSHLLRIDIHPSRVHLHSVHTDDLPAKRVRPWNGTNQVDLALKSSNGPCAVNHRCPDVLVSACVNHAMNMKSPLTGSGLASISKPRQTSDLGQFVDRFNLYVGGAAEEFSAHSPGCGSMARNPAMPRKSAILSKRICDLTGCRGQRKSRSEQSVSDRESAFHTS